MKSSLAIAAAILTIAALALVGLRASAVTWLVVGGVALLIVGVGLWLVRVGDVVAWLRTITPMPIAYVKDGTRVKLVGVVRCVDAPLIAPASERACAAWQLSVYQEAYRTSTGASSGPSPIAIDKKLSREYSGNPFEPKRTVDILLDDGSGIAIIRASEESTLLYLSADGHLKNARYSEGVQGVEERLRDGAGMVLKWEADAGIATFDEAIIAVGSRVTAAGICSVETSPEGERRVVMHANSKSAPAIVISDDPAAVALNPRNPAPGFRMAQ